MQPLKPLEPGVMFWAGAEPRAILRELKELGVRCGQLGIPGHVPVDLSAAAAWRSALEAEEFTICTVFAAYDGESYSSMDTVRRTVGWIPAATRAQRLHRTFGILDFAAALGVPSLGLHVGFIPEDPGEPDYVAVREMTRLICDYAAANRQTFALETGQETAEILLGFLRDVGRENLGVNFDPANMILYGTSDPIEALDLLGPHVLSVHAKDGDWPARPGELGEERPLGSGAVGMERFVSCLRRIGYQGQLHIEREGAEAATRLSDIRSGIKILADLAS